jgi:long-chain acyl-CoA synthetase
MRMASTVFPPTAGSRNTAGVVQLVPEVDPGPVIAEELIVYCRQHLARHKVPRSIDFEARLPRLPTGKLYKRILRDRYWQGHTTRIL